MAGDDGNKGGEARRERLLWVLSAATFFIFFQAYMVAPLIPRLSDIFGVSGQTIGLIVPAYMIPYGVSTLFALGVAWAADADQSVGGEGAVGER